jgi:hypothetical protein
MTKIVFVNIHIPVGDGRMPYVSINRSNETCTTLVRDISGERMERVANILYRMGFESMTMVFASHIAILYTIPN